MVATILGNCIPSVSQNFESKNKLKLQFSEISNNKTS